MSRSQSRELVEKELRNRIRQGVYGPGERLPSERELAVEFGVSRSTLRAAVRALTLNGVLEQNQNCRPIVAQSRESSATAAHMPKHIAVWIQPNLEDIGAAMILQGIRSATEASGYSLLVGFPNTRARDDAQQSEVQFMRVLANQQDVVGAIIWETCAPSFVGVYPALNEVGIPVVFVDREPPEEIEADVISTNNRRGALKAVSHLMKLGHRHIAMVANTEPASSVRDRIEGYRDALRTEGLAERIFSLDNDALGSEPGAYASFVRQMLVQTPTLTAIFCVHDGIALRIQQALSVCGYRVPQDISIVGFDWLQRSLPFGGELTTVAQPFEAIGRIAAERLMERIGNRSIDPCRHILLEAPLVVKSTTGPPSASSRDARERLHASVQS